MQVSVIIPTHNRAAALDRILAILLREIGQHGLTGHVEIVVVDDASEPPAVVALLERYHASLGETLKVVRMEKNRGASAARNLGVEHSGGELLVFIDDDIVPADDYLRAVIEVHRSAPEKLVLNARLLPLRKDVYSRFWFYYYSSTFDKPGDLYQVPMLASGNCSIKRAVVSIENPLFDPALPTQEDFDLYLRLKARGIPVYMAKRILAFNDCRNSLLGFIVQRLRYAEGQQCLLRKYSREVLRSESDSRKAPINWRFLHLYLAFSIVQHTLAARVRIQQLLRHNGLLRSDRSSGD